MCQLKARNAYSPMEVVATIKDISENVLLPSLEKNISRIKRGCYTPSILPSIDLDCSNKEERPSTVPITNFAHSQILSKRLELLVTRDLDSISSPSDAYRIKLNTITREGLSLALLKIKVIEVFVLVFH